MSKHYTKGRHCACGKPIFNESKSGQCKPCNIRMINADPEIARRKGESLKRRHREDPLELARRQAQMRQNVKTALSKPGAREQWVARARKVTHLMFTPEALERKRAGHATAMRERVERMFAWCPAERREDYRRLVRNHRKTAAEAKQIILDAIKAELASLSPFERQMRALERGGRLVANDRVPAFGEAVDYGEAKWERQA